MSVFFWPTVLWVEYPVLTWVPAVLFGIALGRARRSGARGRGLAVATTLWILYAVYETVVYFWSKRVVAPIRIDLILLGPLMYAVTIGGIVAWWRTRASL